MDERQHTLPTCLPPFHPKLTALDYGSAGHFVEYQHGRPPTSQLVRGNGVFCPRVVRSKGHVRPVPVRTLWALRYTLEDTESKARPFHYPAPSAQLAHFRDACEEYADFRFIPFDVFRDITEEDEGVCSKSNSDAREGNKLAALWDIAREDHGAIFCRRGELQNTLGFVPFSFGGHSIEQADPDGGVDAYNVGHEIRHIVAQQPRFSETASVAVRTESSAHLLHFDWQSYRFHHDMEFTNTSRVIDMAFHALDDSLAILYEDGALMSWSHGRKRSMFALKDVDSPLNSMGVQFSPHPDVLCVAAGADLYTCDLRRREIDRELCGVSSPFRVIKAHPTRMFDLAGLTTETLVLFDQRIIGRPLIEWKLPRATPPDFLEVLSLRAEEGDECTNALLTGGSLNCDITAHHYGFEAGGQGPFAFETPIALSSVSSVLSPKEADAPGALMTGMAVLPDRRSERAGVVLHMLRSGDIFYDELVPGAALALTDVSIVDVDGLRLCQELTATRDEGALRPFSVNDWTCIHDFTEQEEVAFPGTEGNAEVIVTVAQDLLSKGPRTLFEIWEYVRMCGVTSHIDECKEVLEESELFRAFEVQPDIEEGFEGIVEDIHDRGMRVVFSMASAQAHSQAHSTEFVQVLEKMWDEDETELPLSAIPSAAPLSARPRRRLPSPPDDPQSAPPAQGFRSEVESPFKARSVSFATGTWGDGGRTPAVQRRHSMSQPTPRTPKPPATPVARLEDAFSMALLRRSLSKGKGVKRKRRPSAGFL